MDDRTFYPFYEERINRSIDKLQDRCGNEVFWAEVIVETDRKKRILYKPHSLANEIFLQELLADIYMALGYLRQLRMFWESGICIMKI